MTEIYQSLIRIAGFPLRILAVLLLMITQHVQAEGMLFTDHPLTGKIWDMASHRNIDEADLIDRVNHSDVVLLGETHDNTLHHEYQQKLLQARIDFVASSGLKSMLMPALMMEQLVVDDQPALDRALSLSNRGEALKKATALVKFNDWKAYQPFLEIAIDNKLQVIAASIPNQRAQPVIWQGFEAYDANELKRLAVETAWNEKRQKFLVDNMGGAHCGKLRDELREGLTRGQRLKDALMVDSAISSVGQGIVAIVGSSHARRDIGLPLYFLSRAPSAKILSVGFVEVSPGVTNPDVYQTGSATGEAPYDVIWFTPRLDRVDPCASLVESKGAE